MLEPLRLALAGRQLAMAGATPDDAVFRLGMPIPHAAARGGIEQPSAAIAWRRPADLQRIGLAGRALRLGLRQGDLLRERSRRRQQR